MFMLFALTLTTLAGPVSYTHLDVYKRQAHGAAGGHHIFHVLFQKECDVLLCVPYNDIYAAGAVGLSLIHI